MNGAEIMKLYITTPSPFARKVRIVAHEKGLSERIEEIAVDPYANAPELLATNPVVQVPTLIAEDGLPLTDSPVICQYLDALGFDGRSQGTDAKARSVLGAVVFIDNDDGKTKFHAI